MASPPARPGSPGAAGLLHGGRARSYGSLVTSAASPVRERRLEHRLAPGDTLPGLALRYGVTVRPRGASWVGFLVLGGQRGRGVSARARSRDSWVLSPGCLGPCWGSGLLASLLLRELRPCDLEQGSSLLCASVSL